MRLTNWRDFFKFLLPPVSTGRRSSKSRRAHRSTTTAAETLELRVLPAATALLSIYENSSSQTATSVSYTVSFDRAVTGVDATDFRVVVSDSVQADNTVVVTPFSDSMYEVTITGLSGTGDVRLDLIDDDTIQNAFPGENPPQEIPLGGAGLFNGSFQGDTYHLLPVHPTVVSIDRDIPTIDVPYATSISYTVTFSTVVTGVDASDFELAITGGLTVADPITVTGSGTTYTVSISGINGIGSVGLNLVDDSTIRDEAGSPLTQTELAPSFESPQQITVGGPAISMALSDLNGDGNLDLVSIINLGGSSALTLALGNGDGTFQPSSSSVFNSAGLQPTSVAIHDLNGDGFLDVVAIYKFTGVVAIYDGNGDGTFQSADVLTIEPSPSSIGFGDIFRDGSPEIFITHETTNSLTILSYNGVDYDVNTTVNTGTAPSGVVVGDFTGYGSRGIATSDKGSNTVSVIYAGDGFSPPDIYQVGDSPSSITAADLNGDGVEDLITANKGSNNVSILIGGFYGTFQPQVTYATGLAPVSVQVTDVNGDGNYDLVVATSDGNAVSVLRGNGDGTFQPSQDVPTGIGPAVVTVGDINGDGRPDLLTADQLGTGVTLLLNATRGDFVGQVYNRLSNGPAFTSPNSVDVPENTPATTNILQVAASNPDDASQTFTYGMTGTDAEQFTIDPATGIIRFNTTPDYELPLDQDQDNVYRVQISANDGLGTTITQNLTITVLPLNDNQPVFSSSNFAFVSENTPAQDVILTAFATDADIPSQTIAYSLSGTDAAKFSIDPNTGAIRFLASPDFEVPGDQDGDNIYDIIVTANDGNGGQQSQIVTISVFPLNDNYPVITSPNSVEVDENTPETDVILTAHATDADLPAQSLGYDLSGTDAELFTIDSQTGEIRFLVSPDYENPLDQNGDNVYEVVLSVGDFQEGTEVQTQTILIKVLPLNDNAPLYESPSYVSVDENTPATTVVQSISAYDIDQPAQTLTYSLSGDDAAWFSISNTGEIRFLNSPNVEAPLDLDGNNVYEITISVTDSGSPSLTTTRTLSIEVLDVGESPIADDGTLDVTENTQTTGQLSGSDQDAESTLTFIILTQPEHGSVELTNPATGAYIYTPDTDYSGPDSFTFQVSDGSLDSNIATVAITVNALNSPPVISETTLSVPENSPNGTVVGTVIAVDPDVVSGPGSDVLTFSITAGNTNDAFSIDPSNGEIRVSNSAALDFETLQQFTLRIRVTDLGGHTVFGSITVNVTNVNEPLIITLPTETPIYRKNGPPAPIDTEATVYDADFTPIEFRGGLLQVTVTNSGASDPNDRISIMVQGTGAGKISLVSNYIVYDSPLNIIGTIASGQDGGPLVINLTTFANEESIGALLRTLIFSNTSSSPIPGTRTITFDLSDGSRENSGTKTKQVEVVTVSEPPVVTLPSGDLNLSLRSSPTSLDALASITDPDSLSLKGGQLLITATQGANRSDRLRILKTGGIKVSGKDILFNGQKIGRLTLSKNSIKVDFTTNSATPAAVQALLRAVAFSTTRARSGVGERQYQVTLSDGAGGRQTTTKQVVVT